ncbi:MAG: class I adenylate-forming enzyme family protein [Thermaerobacter sp.]|nr:class I adenylate-forming enzyme family protein [Thermaerobacter sp.]
MITKDDYRRPSGVVGAGTSRLTVPALLDRWRRELPDRTALVTPDGNVTWGELGEDVERRARELTGFGVGVGTVVGLQSANTRCLVVDHLAIARCGAVTAMIHHPYPHSEASRLAQMVRAAAVLRDGHMVWQAPARSHCAPARPAPDDPLALFFTSGTEGPLPKACLHSHAGLLDNAVAVAHDMGLEPSDTILSASAFTHLFGYLALHLSLVSGAPQVLLARFSPDGFRRAMAGTPVTVLFAVPTHLYDLVRDRRNLSGVAAPLREIRSAGAYLPAGLVESVQARFQVPVVAHWGMSEIGAGLHTNRLDPPETARQTVGRPVGASRVLIVEEGKAVHTPGHLGELVFSGPSLFWGYYGHPAATDAAYLTVDGRAWFRTGDLAAWAPDGRVVFRGRVKDIVNRGGMKVSAQEVEAAVATMPNVRQVALLATPDPRLGERGLLVVSLHSDSSLDLDDVRRHLAVEGMAKFKWPEKIQVLQELPLTATGKVAKGRLRDWLSGAEVSGRLFG